MKKVIFCDPDKCTGCQICEVVCSTVKEKKINPLLSRIRLVRIDPLFAIALTCQGCEEARCVKSCPKKAMFVIEAGVVKIDQDKCDFCGWCIQSCPFGAIVMHSKDVMVCDLCDGSPKCVEHCPKDALIFGTRNEIAQRIRREVVKNLLSQSTGVSTGR